MNELKLYLKVLLFGALIITITGCGEVKQNEYSIEFYILRSPREVKVEYRIDGIPNFTQCEIDETPIFTHCVIDESKYNLDETPIFTQDDIKEYDWETHVITFKDDFIDKLTIDKSLNSIIIGGSRLFDSFYPDKFVVYVNHKEIYSGYLGTHTYSSFMPTGAVVSDFKDGIVINFCDDTEDVRNNEIIYKALKQNKLLK